MASLNMSSTTSTLIILFMTFERFYSIVWPHRAASFSTTRRAKATILCCCIVSTIYSIPHVFTTRSVGRQCIPLGNASQTLFGQMYYWLNFFANFTPPFVILLVMNSVIIHKLRRRSDLKLGQGHDKGRVQGEDKHLKGKQSDIQIYIVLLVVTFSFLILMSPTYVFYIYIFSIDYTKSTSSFALYYLLYHLAHKTYTTNYGINFYLYVTSGHKFRSDLVRLFRKSPNPHSTATSVMVLKPQKSEAQQRHSGLPDTGFSSVIY